MLFSVSIVSQDTLKIINDRALIVTPEGDTIYTYGQDSHFIIEKMFEEQGLLIAEVNNQYAAIGEQLKRKSFADSVYINVLDELAVCDQEKDLVNDRLFDAEQNLKIAETDLVTANNTIKKQNFKIKSQKTFSRIRTVLEAIVIGVALYFVAI